MHWPRPAEGGALPPAGTLQASGGSQSSCSASRQLGPSPLTSTGLHRGAGSSLTNLLADFLAATGEDAGTGPNLSELLGPHSMPPFEPCLDEDMPEAPALRGLQLPLLTPLLLPTGGPLHSPEEGSHGLFVTEGLDNTGLEDGAAAPSGCQQAQQAEEGQQLDGATTAGQEGMAQGAEEEEEEVPGGPGMEDGAAAIQAGVAGGDGAGNGAYRVAGTGQLFHGVHRWQDRFGISVRLGQQGFNGEEQSHCFYGWRRPEAAATLVDCAAIWRALHAGQDSAGLLNVELNSPLSLYTGNSKLMEELRGASAEQLLSWLQTEAEQAQQSRGSEGLGGPSGLGEEGGEAGEEGQSEGSEGRAGDTWPLPGDSQLEGQLPAPMQPATPGTLADAGPAVAVDRVGRRWMKHTAQQRQLPAGGPPAMQRRWGQGREPTAEPAASEPDGFAAKGEEEEAEEEPARVGDHNPAGALSAGGAVSKEVRRLPGTKKAAQLARSKLAQRGGACMPSFRVTERGFTEQDVHYGHRRSRAQPGWEFRWPSYMRALLFGEDSKEVIMVCKGSREECRMDVNIQRVFLPEGFAEKVGIAVGGVLCLRYGGMRKGVPTVRAHMQKEASAAGTAGAAGTAAEGSASEGSTGGRRSYSEPEDSAPEGSATAQGEGREEQGRQQPEQKGPVTRAMLRQATAAWASGAAGPAAPSEGTTPGESADESAGLEAGPDSSISLSEGKPGGPQAWALGRQHQQPSRPAARSYKAGPVPASGGPSMRLTRLAASREAAGTAAQRCGSKRAAPAQPEPRVLRPRRAPQQGEHGDRGGAMTAATAPTKQPAGQGRGGAGQLRERTAKAPSSLPSPFKPAANPSSAEAEADSRGGTSTPRVRLSATAPAGSRSAQAAAPQSRRGRRLARRDRRSPTETAPSARAGAGQPPRQQQQAQQAQHVAPAPAVTTFPAMAQPPAGPASGAADPQDFQWLGEMQLALEQAGVHAAQILRLEQHWWRMQPGKQQQESIHRAIMRAAGQGPAAVRDHMAFLLGRLELAVP